MKTYCWQLEPLGWPCLGQSEWAAWIQVAGAFVAIVLAIYVPIRMRRVEELDRMESIISSMEMMGQLANHYAQTVGDLANAMGGAPIELGITTSACRSHLNNPSTPAALLPSLGHIEHAGRLVTDHWNMATSNPESRSNALFVATAKERCSRVTLHLNGARAQVKAWRRQHRGALLFA